MAGRTTVNQQIIRKALADNPTIATRTLARMLRTKYPECFASVEYARSAIRMARGASGESNRRRTHSVAVRTPEESEACRRWGQLIPQPSISEWGWRKLPTGIDNWLVCADIHIPYHDANALESVLRFAEGRCDGILILGDLCDAYSLSDFCRDPRARDIAGEVAAIGQFFDAIASILHPKAVVWRGANHEYRLSRYLMQRAPELFPAIADLVTWPRLCNLAERGVTWIAPQDPIAVGKLTLLHGDEYKYGITNPVNPARGMYLRSHACTLSAHLHQSSEHTEPDIYGTTVTCWSLGCLCGLHPAYSPFNKWNHGLAELDLSGKEWQIRNHRIVNGKVA
jgi:hypothetical protein